MTEINVMAKEKYKKQFTNIFLLLVSVKRFIAFELASNISQFFVNTFDFGFFALTYKIEIVFYFIKNSCIRNTVGFEIDCSLGFFEIKLKVRKQHEKKKRNSISILDQRKSCFKNRNRL